MLKLSLSPDIIWNCVLKQSGSSGPACCSWHHLKESIASPTRTSQSQECLWGMANPFSGANSPLTSSDKCLPAMGVKNCQWIFPQQHTSHRHQQLTRQLKKSIRKWLHFFAGRCLDSEQLLHFFSPSPSCPDSQLHLKVQWFIMDLFISFIYPLMCNVSGCVELGVFGRYDKHQFHFINGPFCQSGKENS